ncbi:F-box/RNI-like superfamily protein [Rhynchospora pubera]|uniref:F-box/RNI-like superfamily protein n=1 Tax=Rhynchospora pubera TaxID=906938 RepID=A0AAV8G9C0_9POAL|nr:F-box/RNI-like superfamily protein [Rhynchospora pubera]
MASLPNPKRRRCLCPTSDSDTDASLQMDRCLQSTLARATADPSIATSVGLSLERILDSIPLQSDKDTLVQGAINLASSLMQAAIRSARRFATSHNSSVWPLPNDLTINVFSRLDTQSLCFAAAACMLFRRCASDPSCYANIDLTSCADLVTDPVVSTMIQRAGKHLLKGFPGQLLHYSLWVHTISCISSVTGLCDLRHSTYRSINLGSLSQNESILENSSLTVSCLAALKSDGGATGLLLQKLHLYNLKVGSNSLCSMLSACKSLSELEIVGINCWFVHILRTIFEHCRSIEHICLDTSRFYMPIGSLAELSVDELIKNCPLLSSLALRCRIGDDLLSAIVKEARGLKSLDLSGSSSFSGIFLRDLGNGGSANSLETLILRDCMHLRAKEVSRFLSAICYGDWKSLRYVDISNKKGLLVPRGPSGLRTRCAMEVSQVLRERPEIQLMADYPPIRCFDGDCSNLPSSSSSDSGLSSSDDETSSSLPGSDNETNTSSDNETNSSSDDGTNSLSGYETSSS